MMKKRIFGLAGAAILAITMTVGMSFPAFADAISSYYDPTSIDYYLQGSYPAAGEIHANNIMDVFVSSSDGNCRLRTGPGTNYSEIMPIYNGTMLRITAVNQSSYDSLVWGQTTYNGYSGWVSLRLTTVTDIENASQAEYDVTVTEPEYIYMRKGPGTEFPEIYRPYNGQILRIYQTVVNSFDGRPWGKTVINGQSGWVSLNWTARRSGSVYNQYTDMVFYNNCYEAVVSAPDNFLNLRTGPGINCPIIQPVYNGSYLYVTAMVFNSADQLVWGLTTYNGYTGWVSMSQTTITGVENAGTTTYYVTVQNSDNIRLRKGPGTEFGELIGYIPNNTTLYITETMINSFDGRPWGKTSYNGVTGWVSLDWTYRAPGR